MRPLSSRQISMLKNLRHSEISLVRLRKANQVTLWSLLYRGLIRQTGNVVALTKLGDETLDSYNSSALPIRQREADLSQRCRHLLQASRVLRMRKAA